MKFRVLFNCLCSACALLICNCSDSSKISEDDKWKSDLREDLSRLGHRNFIIVADSAYPLQSSPGIHTAYVGGTQVATLKSP